MEYYSNSLEYIGVQNPYKHATDPVWGRKYQILSKIMSHLMTPPTILIIFIQNKPILFLILSSSSYKK